MTGSITEFSLFRHSHSNKLVVHFQEYMLSPLKRFRNISGTVKVHIFLLCPLFFPKQDRCQSILANGHADSQLRDSKLNLFDCRVHLEGSYLSRSGTRDHPCCLYFGLQYTAAFGFLHAVPVSAKGSQYQTVPLIFDLD